MYRSSNNIMRDIGRMYVCFDKMLTSIVSQPFGVGFVTEVLPQMRIYESSLFMWKLTSDKDIHLLHNFVGHRDIVLGFQWRKRREG